MTDDKKRSCGPCRACCFVCPVEAIDKPLMTRCQHENAEPGSEGCLIYDARPHGCQAYRCSWLVGEFAEHHRPDLSGVLFEHTTMGFDDGNHPVTVLLGMTFGEPDDPRAFLRYAEPGKIVAVADHTNQHPEHNLVAGHPRDVERWLDFLSRTRRNGYSKQEGETVAIRVNDSEGSQP